MKSPPPKKKSKNGKKSLPPLRKCKGLLPPAMRTLETPTIRNSMDQELSELKESELWAMIKDIVEALNQQSYNRGFLDGYKQGKQTWQDADSADLL